MFKTISNAATRPALWSEYTAEVLWNDSHIAKQMLNFHLNPNISSASRTTAFIDASVDWLISEFKLDKTSKVIDFGCGPGLYTQRLKANGVGTVVGLDFSDNSLSYAINRAAQLNLSIEYNLGNYLEYKSPLKFDLITLIMCDFCALNPSQRTQLLKVFKSLLAPQGSIALDVYTTTRFFKQSESLSLSKQAMNGFWSAEDYWCIHSSYKYKDDFVTLDKYAIYENKKEWTVYNWLQHFSIEMLSHELDVNDLKLKTIYGDLKGAPYEVGDEMAVIISHK